MELQGALALAPHPASFPDRLERDPALRSKAEEKEEEEHPRDPTKELEELHPHHQEEEEKDFEASTGVSFCQSDLDGEYGCQGDDQVEEELEE